MSSSSASKTHLILHTPRIIKKSSLNDFTTVNITSQLGVVFGRDPIRGWVTITAFKRTLDTGEVGDVEKAQVKIGHVLMAVDGKSIELLYFDDLMKVLRTKPKPYTLTFYVNTMGVANLMARNQDQDDQEGLIINPPLLSENAYSPPPPPIETDAMLSNNNNNDDIVDPSSPTNKTTPKRNPSSTLPSYTARDFETKPGIVTRRRLVMLIVSILFLFILSNVWREEDEVVLEQAASPDELASQAAVISSSSSTTTTPFEGLNSTTATTSSKGLLLVRLRRE
jgi:hypothetical protein